MDPLNDMFVKLAYLIESHLELSSLMALKNIFVIMPQYDFAEHPTST